MSRAPSDPIRVERVGQRVAVSATPGCAWVLGLLFLGVGSTFGYGLAGGFVNLHEVAPWERGVASVMAAAAILVGLDVLRTSRHMRTEIDEAAGTITIVRGRLPFRSTERFALGDVLEVRVTEGDDIDGDPIHGVALRLRTRADDVPLTPILYPDRDACERAAQAIRAAVSRRRCLRDRRGRRSRRRRRRRG